MPAEQNSPVLPFTTGSTGMDSLLRSGIISVSGAVAGACVVWLGKHGYNDPSTATLVFGVVFSVLAGVAGAAWGWLAQKRAKAAIAQHIVTAAATGEVPPSIIKQASPSQLDMIVASGAAKTPEAEVALTAALNKAQVPNG